jgi:DNA-binding Xre family transcriptional regulator
MIVYTPFYETLAKRNMTIYQLIFKEGMSANTFQRIKDGKAITTKTIDELCFILKCQVDEIIKYEENR